MASTAELIKDRLGIVEVISSYIKVESAGANFKARCPFHNEKTPSFFISPSRNTYYCFGCGMKGDIFSFVQEYEKIDFLGALKMLAERANIPLEEFKSDVYKKSERLYAIMHHASMYFYENLMHSPLPGQYIHSRGLEPGMIKDWSIGFANDEWRACADALLNKKIDGTPITVDELEKVGLIKKLEDGRFYDRFRGRIMFPIQDSSGRVVGFSGRIFSSNPKPSDTQEKDLGPKYLNSPDTELFNKSELLYGFDKAKHAIREWGYAVLVEGQMDLLMCHQVGVKNAIATSGTALTDGHLEKIGRLTKNIVFMYDADKAGYGATRRGERLAIKHGFDVKVVSLPQGEDPASLIAKDKDRFVESLKKSTPVIEYYVRVLTDMYPDEHTLIKAIEKEILPDIALTPSAIRRGELISYLAVKGLKSKIDEKYIAKEVEKLVEKIEQHGAEAVLGYTGTNQKNAHDSSQSEHIFGISKYRGIEKRVDVALRRLAALMVFVDDMVAKNVPGTEEIKGYTAESIKRFMNPDDINDIQTLVQSERDTLLFEGEAFFGQSAKLKIHVEDLLIELEEKTLKNELQSCMQELSLAEKDKNKLKSDELISRCQDLSLKLSILHKKKRSGP